MQLFLLDRSGAQMGVLDAVSAVRTRGVGLVDTLELTTRDEVPKGCRVVCVEGGEAREYVALAPQSSRSASRPVHSVTCESALSDLSSHFIVELRNRSMTAAGAMAKALEGTGWELVDEGTPKAELADTSFYHISSLEAVSKVLEAYGIEAEAVYGHSGGRITRRALRISPRLGDGSAAHRFEYGRDLAGVKRTFSGDSPKTRLYAYGKGLEQVGEDGQATGGYSRKIDFADVNGGKPYVEDASMLAQWGVYGPDGSAAHSEGVLDFPDCDDPAELLSLTRRAFEAQREPQVSYTADVVALSRAGEGFEGAALGDTVQIVDASFPEPLRLSGRVLEVKEDLLGGSITLTLGSIVPGRRAASAAVSAAVERLTSSSGAWSDAAGLRDKYVSQLLSGLNAVLNAVGGYAYLTENDGIWIYSEPRETAVKNPKAWVLHLSGGYLRLANSKKSDGSWDFKNISTANGIVAAELVTGSIRSPDGSLVIDIDSGQLKISAGTQLGGGGTVGDIKATADGAAKDVAALKTTEEKHYSELKQTATSISSTVTSVKATADGAAKSAEAAGAAASKAQGAADGAQSSADSALDGVTSLGERTDALDAAQAEVVGRVSKVEQTAEGIRASVATQTRRIDDMSGTVNSVEAFMDFGQDSSGRPELTLGASNSKMKSVLRNDSQSFFAGGQEVLRLDGNTAGVVASRMKLGRYEWRPTNGGANLGLVYTG